MPARQYGSFAQLSAPAGEPITADQAKAHARVEHSSEDALFAKLIPAARRFVELNTGLAIVTQTWRASFNNWDDAGLRLRPSPVSSIDAVRVWDGASMATQALAGFQLVKGRPAFVLPVQGVRPPNPMRSHAGIQIDFTSGYGVAADCPEDLQAAMLMLITHWFEHREPTAISAQLSVVGDVKFTIETILQNYRSLRLA